MSIEVIAGVVVLAGTVIAYLERKSLKAEVLDAKANVAAAGEKFLNTLRVRESQVRAKIAGEVAKIIVEAKTEAVTIEDAIKTGAIKTDGLVQALVAKVEADLRKVI